MNRYFVTRRPAANEQLPNIVMDRKLNHQLCYCAYREQAERIAAAMNASDSKVPPKSSDYYSEADKGDSK
jgi:hypothetical protein